MNCRVDIAEIFKNNRSRLGLTQKQMADHLCIKRGTYGSYEEGRGTPSVSEVVRIAQRLGYDSIDTFLGINEKKKAECPVPLELKYARLTGDKKKIVDFILN